MSRGIRSQGDDVGLPLGWNVGEVHKNYGVATNVFDAEEGSNTAIGILNDYIAIYQTKIRALVVKKNVPCRKKAKHLSRPPVRTSTCSYPFP